MGHNNNLLAIKEAAAEFRANLPENLLRKHGFWRERKTYFLNIAYPSMQAMHRIDPGTVKPGTVHTRAFVRSAFMFTSRFVPASVRTVIITRSSDAQTLWTPIYLLSLPNFQDTKVFLIRCAQKRSTLAEVPLAF